jgi:hypothetical protein
VFLLNLYFSHKVVSSAAKRDVFMLAYFDPLYNAFIGQNFVTPSATFIADIMAIIIEKGDQHFLLSLAVLHASTVRPHVMRMIASILFKLGFICIHPFC